MILKVCGITNQPDADAAIAAGATAIGFNFYPKSPRYLAPEAAARIATPGALRVGVFVNEPAPRIAAIAGIAALDVAQLHGDETPAQYPAAIAVWKAAASPPISIFRNWTRAPPMPSCSTAPPPISTAAPGSPSIGIWLAAPAIASSSPAASMPPTSRALSGSLIPGASIPAPASSPRQAKRTISK